MSMVEPIRIALVKRGNISESELARRVGVTPQNFNNKMKRDNFSERDLQEIADALGMVYSTFTDNYYNKWTKELFADFDASDQ